MDREFTNIEYTWQTAKPTYDAKNVSFVSHIPLIILPLQPIEIESDDDNDLIISEDEVEYVSESKNDIPQEEIILSSEDEEEQYEAEAENGTNDNGDNNNQAKENKENNIRADVNIDQWGVIISSDDEPEDDDIFNDDHESSDGHEVNESDDAETQEPPNKRCRENLIPSRNGHRNNLRSRPSLIPNRNGTQMKDSCLPGPSRVLEDHWSTNSIHKPSGTGAPLSRTTRDSPGMIEISDSEDSDLEIIDNLPHMTTAQ